MKKLLTIALLTLSTMAFASDVKWDSVELSKRTESADGIKDFKGYEVGGTLLIDNLILTASKTRVESDMNVLGYDVNMEVELVTFGIGGKVSVTKFTDLYAIYSEIEVDTKISVLGYSASDSDEATSIRLGSRSMATDKIEISTYLEKVKMYDTTINKNVSVAYHFNEWSLGFGYTKAKEETGTAITAKMYF